MLNYKKIDKIKVDNYYINLNKSINLLYLNELFNASSFVIYFNYNNLLNKDLYNLKNEILKMGLKSYVINSSSIKKIFDKNFFFLNSNIFFIFCNKLQHFIFLLKLLHNINFFCFFNKCIVSTLNKNMYLSAEANNLNFFHFILFKLLFNVLIVLLFYVVYFIKSLRIKT